jgi:hypothetical protein
MAFAKSWIVEILFARLQTKGILASEFFRRDALPYSAVWIDSNSSWMEIGCQKPTEMCGRQGVSIQSGCVYMCIIIILGAIGCKEASRQVLF